MADGRLLVLRLRQARRKARPVATAEAVALFRDLDPELLPGGPQPEPGPAIWLLVPQDRIERAIHRLPLLGYCDSAALLEPAPPPSRQRKSRRSPGIVRWRGGDYRFVRIYMEDAAAVRNRAPDKRTFLLESLDGVIRPVAGYRGDGAELSRRALPVADARMLVNLVADPDRGILLDPFGGVGGIALEARASGWDVLTLDIDPRLRFGLRAHGRHHLVGDAARLPLRNASIDAIATEPPYSPEATGMLTAALREMARVLKPGARISTLCAAHQVAALRGAGASLPLRLELDETIDRKGTDVHVLQWAKQGLIPSSGDSW